MAYDLSTCATLISCFDFNHRGFVDRDDWRRGTKMLSLVEMGEDEALWTKLVSKYGSNGSVNVARLAEVVPMDPRQLLMMKAMMSSIAGFSDSVCSNWNRATHRRHCAYIYRHALTTATLLVARPRGTTDTRFRPRQSSSACRSVPTTSARARSTASSSRCAV
jgi:hypothetical protein